MKRLIAIMLLAAPAGLFAQQAGDDDIVNKIINVPAPASFQVNGVAAKPKVRSDAQVQGGKMLRIEIPGASPQPWSISLGDAITKPVKSGDRLVLAFWARLAKGENGATTATLPANSVQIAREPYTAVFGGPATIGPEWKLHEVRGVADKDYAAGDLGVSIHLATAKQTVDFGPIFVLDLGPAG